MELRDTRGCLCDLEPSANRSSGLADPAYRMAHTGRVSSAAELSNEARIYYLRKYRAEVAHRKVIDPGQLALLAAYDAKIAAVGKIAAATAAASRDQAGHQYRPWPDAGP